MKFDIAIGKYRKAQLWKNSSVSWAFLQDKCSETIRTAETIKEYFAAEPDRQAEIKDRGGFVSGEVAGGRRLKKNISFKQILTIDADFADLDFWDNLQLTFGCKLLVHTTHKHTPDKPRFRILIPLSREVDTEEYEPLIRKVCELIGLHQIDPTCFDVNRLVYWPTTAKDGEFLYYDQDGRLMDPDRILKLYRDWRDISSWPMTEGEQSKFRSDLLKQADPWTKRGIVGKFCTVYTIKQALDEFLQKYYFPTDEDDRRTYADASTSKGLVIYDDTFAYSHHNTDPACGIQCNAFDLVRLHLFGHEDEKQMDKPVHLRKSYDMMRELCTQDPQVRQLIVSEKVAKASSDFEGVLDDGGTGSDDTWMQRLEIDKNNNVLATIDNVVVILENDPEVKGTFAKDDFEKREIALRDLPWRKAIPKKGKIDYTLHHLKDSDDANFYHWLEHKYGLAPTTKVSYGLNVIIERNKFHPVKDYLNSLKWDGKKRLDTVAIEYLGVVDTNYTRMVTRKAFVAAVARIFEPGIKFDNTLTFVGAEGLGKSTLIDKMGGRWFSDSLGDIEKSKDAMESLQGAWIIEVAELSSFRNATIEKVKHFLGKKVDKFRVAYGKRTEHFPRQCVFFASTNDFKFLVGMLGNRRFWPLEVRPMFATKNVFKHLTEDVRGQIWAEAFELYMDGEALHLDAETELEAREVQKLFTVGDPREEMVQRYLEMPLPKDWEKMGVFERRAYFEAGEYDQGYPRTKVCIPEIWCEVFGGQQREMTPNNTKVIHTILNKIEGWNRSENPVNFKIYGRSRGYMRESKMPKFYN